MHTRDTALSWQTGVRKKKCKKTERKGRKKNGARVRSLICSLLQCCHSHRCIPWMPGQRGRVSGGRAKEGRGKNFHSSTSLGLSLCVKVGQHTHTHTYTSRHTHTYTQNTLMFQTAQFHLSVGWHQGPGEVRYWRKEAKKEQCALTWILQHLGEGHWQKIRADQHTYLALLSFGCAIHFQKEISVFLS